MQKKKNGLGEKITYYHIMLYQVRLAMSGNQTRIDCTGSCKSNYHMITTTTALNHWIAITIIWHISVGCVSLNFFLICAENTGPIYIV